MWSFLRIAKIYCALSIRLGAITVAFMPSISAAQLSGSFLAKRGIDPRKSAVVSDYAMTQVQPYYFRFERWKACLSHVAGPLIASNVPGDVSIGKALTTCESFEQELKASIGAKIGIDRAYRVIQLARDFETFDASEQYGKSRPPSPGSYEIGDWRIVPGNVCLAISNSLNDQTANNITVIMQEGKDYLLE